MESGLGESRKVTSPRAAEPDLRLLTELRPWHNVFLENLRDTILRRKPERVWTTSPPGKFWPDVFVSGGIPWGRMTESGVLHVLAVMMLVTFTHLYFFLEQRNTIKLRPPSTTLHYEVSEYLPPINTGSPPAPKPRKGQPLLAKQEIISLPPRPDNFEQTIISPADVKLPTNVPLPNIVAWTPMPGPPEANTLRNTEHLKVPQLPTNVIAPPTEAQNLNSRNLPLVDRNVIGPAPDATPLMPDRKADIAANVIGPPPTDDAKLRTPREIIAIAPSVIGPPPDANVSRNLGAMNIGKIAPTVAQPQLQVAEQRAVPMALPRGGKSLQSGAGGATGGGQAASVPPVPIQGGPNTGNVSGQLIALNLHPVPPSGPVSVPPGRRTGEFAAGPQGKPDAPGTPEIKGGGTGAGGSGTGKSGPGNGGPSNVPAGIVVGNAPGAPPPGSVVVAGTPAQKTTGTNTPKFDDAAKTVTMASARPPRVGETPTESTNVNAPTSPRIEDKIFSGKKSYTLALNMPNLSSAGGSWIIRFAQLDNDKTAGDVTAPVATTTVDPAYPTELMRQGVEGTVVLYAVIHKDGTVGEVRILRGLQGRLDENARIALLRWKFRPGTKNGQAVDLEAVVQIPYRAGRIDF